MNRSFWQILARKWSLPLNSKDRTVISDTALLHAKKDKTSKSYYSANPLDDDDQEEDDEY